ncbi:MAG: hypothetical protein HY674_04140 [Chloroflexi bacterium]|nr:hypothetical protein [Chloroflexota bacterium]
MITLVAPGPLTVLNIGTNEVAELISWDAAVLNLNKEGRTWTLNNGPFPKIIPGPATYSLEPHWIDWTTSQPTFCTIRITPESFSADKTLIIPEDTSANIFLECSSDLVIWTNAVPGLYTNMTDNLFFRLRGERLP